MSYVSCCGINKKGFPCKNGAPYNKFYCHQHKDQEKKRMNWYCQSCRIYFSALWEPLEIRTKPKCPNCNLCEGWVVSEDSMKVSA